MKKIMALLLVVVMLLTMAVAVNAKGISGVKKGVPTIDGHFDNLYKDTVCSKGDSSQFAVPDGGNDVQVVGADDVNCYILWNDKTIYFYVVVYDTTECSGDKFTIMPNRGDIIDATYEFGTEQVTYKAFADGGDAYVESDCDLNATYDSAKHCYILEWKCVFTDKAIDTTNGYGFHWVYWNDNNDDGEYDNYICSGFFANDSIKFSKKEATGTGYDDSYIKAGADTIAPIGDDVETKAPTTQAPSGDNGNSGSNSGSKPQTSDGMMIVGAVALCAAAAAIVVAKKKKD